uniref:Plasmodium vivax Vir protein n=1 Tax=Strongyloides stercoralis TaxID=6248 RepID=A0A0K0DWG1_STRER
MPLLKLLNESIKVTTNFSIKKNVTKNSINNTNTSILNFCSCIYDINQICEIHPINKKSQYYYFNNKKVFYGDHNNDLGAVIYTIAIILMFSTVIIMSMFRSIKRSKESIEIENLLHIMRYREEYDYYKRQKRKLQKAKKKVTAWLNKSNDKMWTSSAHIIGSHSYADSNYISKNNSKLSTLSLIPNIVISSTNDDLSTKTLTRKTPSLSMIYNFDQSFSSSITSNYSLSIPENVENNNDV